jgi:hypothetical protein
MNLITRNLAVASAFAAGLFLALAVIADPTTAPSNMLKDPLLKQVGTTDGWQSSSIEDASVSIAADTTDADHPALKATIDKVDGTDWHAQIFQSDLTIQKGAKYTLTLTAKTSAPRKLAAFIQKQDDPYTLLTEGNQVNLTTDAKPQKIEFTANDDATGAKLTIVLGDATGTVTLSDISLVKK